MISLQFEEDDRAAFEALRNGVRDMEELEWCGQTWLLRADRSAYWVQGQTLVVADTHFGKAEHFRVHGLPVPHGTTGHTLDRLDVALQATGAERLVILGDFFHAKLGVTDALLAKLITWRRRWDGLEVINVRGNHDRSAGDPPPEVGIRCEHGPWRDDRHAESSIAFAHEPCVVSNAGVLCGHLHPGVVMEGLANSRLRAACFHFTQRTATLPAFGAFTGMSVILPKRGDRVFVVGPGVVVEVTPKPAHDAATKSRII